MSLIKQSPKQRYLREVALFLSLLLVGLVLLPITIYVVGGAVFGAYGGQGFGDFFGIVSGRFRNGDAIAWFLVLSPYLVWQILRLTALAWRLVGPAVGENKTKPPGLA
ncbi:MAG: hypothetical protein O2907_02970 [Proteobacteria bacterium]|nr:hypothetical protein [Pseudomonadota bacterium]MDA1063295.1 hypothetical protein [Pseudomonadota bacterium]